MAYLQVTEYYALKGEATKRCGVLDMELNKLLQERETDRNALQFEQRRLVQATERVKNVIFMLFLLTPLLQCLITKLI